MTGKSVLAASVSAAVLSAGVLGSAGAGAQQAPVASYWMDVATTSGFGAGMTSGSQPSVADVMAMMRGGAGSVGHTIDLRLASKTKPAAAPKADHWVPGGLQMGPSLPLLTPVREPSPPPEPGLPPQFQKPKGRMLIYWGCGEHVSAGQPTVIDFAKVADGKVPPGMAAMANAVKAVSGPYSAPGFGRWPNEKDSRAVPAAGSLIGAHKVSANYAPEIAFSLAQGQDFMPGLGLREGGALPSGAARLQWNPAAQATGYALAMFGASGSGDVIMWSSSSKAAMMPHLDYLAPAEVKRQVAAGAVLPPSADQCILPAEVAAAVPMGMITMIGYGPEADFAEAPKNPKWTAKVRYKTTASLMRGMGAMMGGMAEMPAQQQAPAQQQQPQKKKKRSLLGDIIQGATGIPVEQN